MTQKLSDSEREAIRIVFIRFKRAWNALPDTPDEMDSVRSLIDAIENVKEIASQ